MLPVVEATLKHFETSSEAGGQQDPKLLSRAKRRSKYAQRSQTFQEHGAVFKVRCSALEHSERRGRK